MVAFASDAGALLEMLSLVGWGGWSDWIATCSAARLLRYTLFVFLARNMTLPRKFIVNFDLANIAEVGKPPLLCLLLLRLGLGFLWLG